jgi:hypothetical protein
MGFTIGDFAKRDPFPPETKPTAMPRELGCLELQFGYCARLEQSYSLKTIYIYIILGLHA